MTFHLPRLNVIDSPINTLSLQEQSMLIMRWARQRQSRIVCLANVHMVMEAHWSSEFRSILESSDLVVSDGMPLVWTLKAMGVSNQQRVAGMDLFYQLCSIASDQKVSVFFLGSQAEVLAKIREKLEKQYPNLKVAAMKPLPFRPLSESEDKALIQELNGSNAGIVFVCLGCPKQERWIAEHRGKVHAVMLGVGAVFPVYAGLKSHAPRLLRQMGFEWLYRLIQEPRRLWPRYSQTIPPFLHLVTCQILSQLKSPERDSLKGQFLIGRQINENLPPNLLNANIPVAKIGQILLRYGLINQKDILSALSRQKMTQQKIGEIFVDEKLLSESELNYYLVNQRVRLWDILKNRKVFGVMKVLDLVFRTDSELASFLVNTKMISSKYLNLLMIEIYLRRQGWWLNYDQEFSLLDYMQIIAQDGVQNPSCFRKKKIST